MLTVTRVSPSLPSVEELERSVHELWSAEPVCPASQRRRLLDELRALTIDVERLDFRLRFHPDEVPDAAVIRDCSERLDRLTPYWPSTAVEPTRLRAAS